MSGYNAFMIARTEHQEMIRSVPSVSEYGEALNDTQPGILARSVDHLRDMVGSGLVAVGTWLRHERDGLVDVPHAGQEETGIMVGKL